MSRSNGNTIAQREAEIVGEFMLFDDWMGRYEYLIELGKGLAPMPEEFHIDEFKIRGCQSQVWIKPEMSNGIVRFLGDSDALITKGLVALLIRVLDDQPADAIASAELRFLDEIGMKEHLSPTRKNGLSSMIQQMKRYGAALATTN
jgi:cysteine desulfuration protein SufE